jgi:hypothetical protein
LAYVPRRSKKSNRSHLQLFLLDIFTYSCAVECATNICCLSDIVACQSLSMFHSTLYHLIFDDASDRFQ